jgi:wyosine [tRNA(Phe)-imidazoG37] synthetase (radical SAM superfamily)
MILHAQPEESVHSELAAETIYGPVPSRRYGVTLGINLMPLGEKRCSLRCTYCQIGPERDPKRAVIFADLERLRREVTLAVTTAQVPIDAWVLSGNGESTLHPQFAQVVELLRLLREQLAPKTPLVLLTAGTELVRPEVLQACRALDEVAVKLDAGTQALYERLDMPWQPTPVATVPRAASQLQNAIAQTLLVQGSVDNTTDAEVAAWLDLLDLMQPQRVDLYTLARPPIEKALRPATAAVMAQVAEKARQRGFVVRVFADGLDD